MRQRTVKPEYRRVGDAAVAVELSQAGSVQLAARARGLWQRLEGLPFPGYREAVPTARGLLVLFTPGALSFDEVCVRLAQLLEAESPLAGPPRLHDVPVLYGGEGGPDLPVVAERCGRTPAEVVGLHAGREYEALMLGFMPGFAYLGPLAPELRLPRRATPRTRVEPGSVAIAADRTAVYPAQSPGGWHVIGRTSVTFFDPLADPPVRILPGDRVRFVAVGELPEPAPAATESSSPGAPALEVLEPGLLTSVQDAGRTGFRRFGVAMAGALDVPALASANLVLGNPPDAAGLECTLVGPRLRFLATTRFALCGADLRAVLEREDLGDWPVPLGTPVLARAGSVLAFGERRTGARTYLALAGGIDVPVRLGSRSTDLKAGFGGHEGRALRDGDRLALGRAAASERAPAAPGPRPKDDDELELRIVPGPQDDHFDDGALLRLCAASYTLGADSDRFGARLQGPRLPPRGPSEIDSDGLLPGCIQVPADGQPIVALAEGPTTGGYPKIATIVSADVARLGQAVPGLTRLRFRLV